ncbi:MAG: hypothetical protein Q9169_001946 [Polycauliona sp. 2 TL-2023]
MITPHSDTIELVMTKTTPAVPNCKFPPHSEPRVWLLSAGASPIGIALSRQLLAHGDFVVFGAQPSDTSETPVGRAADFTTFWTEEILMKEGWKDRAKFVGLDGRCEQDPIVGTVEELTSTSRSTSLIRDQFETNYFGPVNLIKAALPSMREKHSGHIILLTGITGHLGTPGLGVYCASQWAIEGFCDSLSYEVAPFNIKMTIVQPNLEINVLTNQITAAPQLPQYTPERNPAPIFREIIGGLLDRVDATAMTDKSRDGHSDLGKFSSTDIVSVHPQLSEGTTLQLLAETVNALAAVGGHDNPPARHIVGHEAVASVKEKLKTVSEELEDFFEVSCAVDLHRQMGGQRSDEEALNL